VPKQRGVMMKLISLPFGSRKTEKVEKTIKIEKVLDKKRSNSVSKKEKEYEIK
jgi:hypothetical protein